MLCKLAYAAKLINPALHSKEFLMLNDVRKYLVPQGNDIVFDAVS